jgi:hypothetical protein
MTVAERVATCLWRVNPELLVAIGERLGEPTDAYVNGSHTWIRDDGPNEVTLEWRLHPVAGYERPAGVGVYELWEQVMQSLCGGGPMPAALDALWEGLEAFPGFGDEVEPAPLAATCADVLGIAPDVYGVVDHDRIGDAWETANGSVSIVALLFDQLAR